MLKIALLIAAGATAVRAFGSMPRQLELVRTEDAGVCAGGSNRIVDWPDDERTTTAQYTKCWNECEMASAQSFKDDIYGVPPRGAESNSPQRDWVMGTVEFKNFKNDYGEESCFCHSECKCIHNFGRAGEIDIISQQGAAPIAALDEPSCCEQGFTDIFTYCAEAYDDGRPNRAFPEGRTAGYYMALYLGLSCKNPIAPGKTIEGPFNLDEVSANCNSVITPHEYSWQSEQWVMGEVEQCIERPVNEPLRAVDFFESVTPENANHTMPANSSFYYKFACDGADRSLSLGAYWSMKDCVDDDAAHTNAPATALPYRVPGFQYTYSSGYCGDPPEVTTASTRTASARSKKAYSSSSFNAHNPI